MGFRRVAVGLVTLAALAPGTARAYHDEVIFSAPPFATAETMLYADCAAHAGPTVARLDGWSRVITVFDGGSCAPNNQFFHQAVFEQGPVTVEDGRTYRLIVEYDVEDAWASSQGAMDHIFEVDIDFERGWAHLMIGEAAQASLRGRCSSADRSSCAPDEDLEIGHHRKELEAVADCEGLPSCELDLTARVVVWSILREPPVEPDEITGSAGAKVAINEVTLSTDLRTGPARITGTVRDDVSAVSEACISLTDAEDAGNVLDFLTTDEDGSFSTVVEPGTYLIRTADCRELHPRWEEEWFPDAATSEDAERIVIRAHDEVTVPIVLARRFAPDLAVRSLRVENDPLRTDNGNAPVQPGTQRIITASVMNRGNEAWRAPVSVTVCPRTNGLCQQVGSDTITLKAGERRNLHFQWNALGWIGDVRVDASITPEDLPDPDTANNAEAVDSFVVVGGTGFGGRIFGL